MAVKKWVNLVNVKNDVFSGNNQCYSVFFNETNKTVLFTISSQKVCCIAMCGKQRVLCFCQSKQGSMPYWIVVKSFWKCLKMQSLKPWNESGQPIKMLEINPPPQKKTKGGGRSLLTYWMMLKGGVHYWHT